MSQADCCYVPLNCNSDNIENDESLINETYFTDNNDFETNDDCVDKVLKTYGKESIIAKIIFSMFLMNPLLKLLITGFIYF